MTCTAGISSENELYFPTATHGLVMVKVMMSITLGSSVPVGGGGMSLLKDEWLVSMERQMSRLPPVVNYVTTIT